MGDPGLTTPLQFGPAETANAEELIVMALREDLAEAGDLTCQSMIDETAVGTVRIVAREVGVLSGMPIARQVFAQLDATVQLTDHLSDGSELMAGSVVASLTGPLRSLLSGERTALNFLTRMSGVASLAAKFVAATEGTSARILDTRKTLPGWRMLDKYAVRCGGATNHRIGLFDGIIIKDNHLAAWLQTRPGATLADAVHATREHLAAVDVSVPIEVEVDTLDQLRDVLTGAPDRVLLDNMDVETLAAAVAIRNELAAKVELEASGGVTLETVPSIAASGVDFISAGALTHSAPALDLAFDWGGAV